MVMAEGVKKTIKKTKKKQGSTVETTPANATAGIVAPTRKKNKIKQAAARPVLAVSTPAESATEVNKVAPRGESIANKSACNNTKDKSVGNKYTPEQEALAKEAISLIIKGISAPGVTQVQSAFIPDVWAKTYKTKLGKYRRFIEKHPDLFKIVSSKEKPNNFVIKNAKDASSDANKLVVSASPKLPASPKPRFASSPRLSPKANPRVGLAVVGSPKSSPKVVPAKKAKFRERRMKRKVNRNNSLKNKVAASS